MKVAIIPARGGSKRILRKNIKEFAGKPMIAWAIEAANNSGMFDEVIVSSDDQEILDIAKKLGGSKQFLRPERLADDMTPTVPVIAHAIEECANLGWHINSACCIYPGVPFLDPADLINAHSLMDKTGADFVYPVTEFAHPTQRAMRQLASGQMVFIDPKSELARTQDLEMTFHDAGQFYWGKASAWREHKKMHTDGIGMVIPNWRVVDIDTPDDWKRAELLSAVIKNYQ